MFGTTPVIDIYQFVSGSTYEKVIPLDIVENTLNDFTVKFTSPTTGKIVASVGSPQPQALTVVASSGYTILITDRIIEVSYAGAIITLPTAV